MIIEQYAFKKLIGKMQAILAFPKLYASLSELFMV